MERIDVIAYLLNEAKQEQELLKQYDEAEKFAIEKATQAREGGDKYASCYTYLNWNGNLPHKSTILHNLRTVRRLCMQEIKEMN